VDLGGLARQHGREFRQPEEHEIMPKKSASKAFAPKPPHRQSGVVPFRKSGKNGLEVLMITSRGRGRWIVPKGDVERKLSPSKSALAEAYEEAGLKGRTLGKPLGSYTYKKPENGFYKVKLYAMEVGEECDDWPEKAERKRKWLPLAEAADLADDKEVGVMIRKLGKALSKSKSAKST
jgi:8-oxo-dGTP pyrophosphatase MutT (NUDIX family)